MDGEQTASGSSGAELPVLQGYEAHAGFGVAHLDVEGPRDPYRVSPTRPGRLTYAATAMVRYPYLAALPHRDLRPEVLHEDPVLGQEFVYVPFAGPKERGWAAWMFATRAQRDAFVRRYLRARPVDDLAKITQLSGQPLWAAQGHVQRAAKHLHRGVPDAT